MEATFGDTALGDELVGYSYFPVRTVGPMQELLWSARGYVPDESPNWLWRIRLRVLVEREDVHTFNSYLGTLARSLVDAGKATLTVKEGASTVVSFAACRFEKIGVQEASLPVRGNMSDAVELEFVTSSDPQIS